jgi:hypothetical protein
LMFMSKSSMVRKFRATGKGSKRDITFVPCRCRQPACHCLSATRVALKQVRDLHRWHLRLINDNSHCKTCCHLQYGSTCPYRPRQRRISWSRGCSSSNDEEKEKEETKETETISTRGAGHTCGRNSRCQTICFMYQS